MADTAMEHVDVLVIGAGLSGVGAGCHLTMSCPNKSFVILESRDTIGGTWDLFRYPGIRSDSDMYTLGYPFRPWKEAKAIADGPSILRYVRETAQEFGVDKKVRFRHKVVSASWSTEDVRWTVDIERTDTGERLQMTADFLLTCTGYYRYDEGYTPDFPGTDRFRGTIVHPQHWPEDLDYTGKRVVVIGSGATAVTLVPSMAPTAAHVTMLQRSPSYVLSLPEQDPLAKLLRKFLSPSAAFPVIRWKNVLTATLFYQLSKRRPKLVKRLLRKGLEAALPSGYAIDTHFKPKYDPWDQRLCFVPDGDLFKVLSDGSASVETDTIDTFTESGIRLASGKELEADIIVTATGLNMLAVGGMKFVVDGRPMKLSETVGYKGMMFSGIPNLATAVGYTNASWTLKCDLTCEYVCRLLNYMDEEGYRQVVPSRPDPSEPTLPFIDLKSGYVQRSIDDFPRQGTKAPWRLYQNYIRDVMLLRHGKLADEALQFTRGGRRASARDEDRAPAA
ncbi:MAG TPA: NAD(P)/FAD-dependent oxidoreductase [Mycobacteriales bacterium]|nr:NAD(P)/FAD-dependent oxidoreductase [Mycobacteriales bacterium]